MLESFFNKVADLKAYNFFIKQKIQYRCFSVKFAKFLRAHYRTPPVAVSVKILIRQFFREVKQKLIFANQSKNLLSAGAPGTTEVKRIN